MYVAFVELKKAFYTVNHNKLLEVAFNKGVRGKFFCTLKVMIVMVIGATEPQLIAFISLSRYLDLTKSNLWENNFK